MGDYLPYVLRSDDRGRTWKSIAGDLPKSGTVYTFVEDPIDRDLWFVGTEFGIFFSRDGGKRWVQLKGGLPTIPVREIAIQERESDLVLATFGRGFYILDDYTVLRSLAEARLDTDAFVSTPRTTRSYHQRSDLGLPGKGFFGETFYTAPNPAFGATFTYYLKDELKTRKKIRQEAEKDLAKADKDVFYPTWEALRTEAAEEDPAVWLTVRDATGNVVRRVSGSTEAGVHRATWDLRYPTHTPTTFKEPEDNPFSQPDRGPIAAPGSYSVSLSKRVDGKEVAIGELQQFEIQPLAAATLAAEPKEVAEFQKQVAALERAAQGAASALDEAKERIKFVKKALEDTPNARPALRDDVRSVEAKLRQVELSLRGDRVLSGRNEATPPSLLGRVGNIVGTQWDSSAAPTGTSREQFAIASALLADTLTQLRAAVELDLAKIEAEIEKAGGPWTPGRIPNWP